MENKPYVIYAPIYSKSAGCRVLYRLAELLEQKGYEAYVFAPPSDDYKKCNYISHKEITEELRKNAIIIYPEIVEGNPLQFQNVVRYVLYYPGKNGGRTVFHKSELIYTFLNKYYPKADLLFISTLDYTLFYKDNTPKTVDCYFVYKNGKWRDVPEFANMIEINMKYPETRKELADLLRRTKNFYSYDANTLLLAEAAVCGCNVYIVTEDGFEKSVDAEVFKENAKLTEVQLDSFIVNTQKMHYTGKPEPINLSYEFERLKSGLKYYLYKYILFNKSAAIKHYYLFNRYIR